MTFCSLFVKELLSVAAFFSSRKENSWKAYEKDLWESIQLLEIFWDFKFLIPAAEFFTCPLELRQWKEPKENIFQI